MKGLVPAVPQLSVMPYVFRGEQAQETLDEINAKIDSEHDGNKRLKVLRMRNLDGVPTITGSSPLILPIVNQVIAPDYRLILPEELETTLQEGDPVRIRGNHYVDTGLVLDFSGKNHELAVETFEGLPSELRDFDRLPAVMVGYGLANTQSGDYGIMPIYQEGSELRTAKILAEPTADFRADDAQLIKTGLPSNLGRGNRRLYNSKQREPSKDNLGLSGLYLCRDLSLSSDYEDLAGSDEVGRVVSVRAEGARSEE